MPAADFTVIPLCLGLALHSAFQINTESGWVFLEFINELLAGQPGFTPYKIPADRAAPFLPKFVKLEEI
jgi:hypothetical protein